MTTVRAAHALARFVVVAGLAADSYVHFDLAGTYSETGGVISEGVLFRAEAVLALLVAIVIVITGRRAAYIAALFISASALAAMLVARYVDLGAIGPFPDVYDPVWFPEKVFAAIGEGLAGLAAAAGIAMHRGIIRKSRSGQRDLNAARTQSVITSDSE